jgi:hypothetical protein
MLTSRVFATSYSLCLQNVKPFRKPTIKSSMIGLLPARIARIGEANTMIAWAQNSLQGYTPCLSSSLASSFWCSARSRCA